jgi:predicted DNA-binding WGR domain protein
MKRYFEFVGGSSSKFWEISSSGTDVTVRFGKIGTNGQTQTKTLADADAATKHAEKLIAEKTAKGYQETAAQ